jgi:hypothetical protein
LTARSPPNALVRFLTSRSPIIFPYHPMNSTALL